MKKLASILAILLAGTIAAQNVAEMQTIIPVKQVNGFSFTQEKSITDTAAWYLFAAATPYSLNKWVNGGYVGANGVLANGNPITKTAQTFHIGYYFGLSCHRVEGVLIFNHVKSQTDSITDTLTVNLKILDDSTYYTIGSTNYGIVSPGTQVSYGIAPWGQIDTASSLSSSLTYVPLLFPTLLFWDYAIELDLNKINTSGDSIGYWWGADNSAISTADNFTLYDDSTSKFWVHTNDIVNGGWSKLPGIWTLLDKYCIGIEEQGFADGFKLDITPNPTSDYVRVQYQAEETGDIKIEIIDLSGRIVYRLSESNVARRITNNVTVDVIGLSPGNYFVSITNGKDRQTQKLVISR